MARQNMRPEPWLKHMEAFRSFVGGLNTTSPESSMLNVEVSDIQNMDISDRGSLSRRAGMKSHGRRGIWLDVKGFTWGDLKNL